MERFCIPLADRGEKDVGLIGGGCLFRLTAPFFRGKKQASLQFEGGLRSLLPTQG